jgi:hypothetical protein
VHRSGKMLEDYDWNSARLTVVHHGATAASDNGGRVTLSSYRDSEVADVDLGTTDRLSTSQQISDLHRAIPVPGWCYRWVSTGSGCAVRSV